MNTRDAMKICAQTSMLLMLVVGGCGTRQVGASKPGTGAGEPQSAGPRLEQVVAIDWALEPLPERGGAARTRVSLAMTDETGATRIEPLGEFAGRCAEAATGTSKAILALACMAGDGGLRLEMRRYGTELVLVRAPTGADGVVTDELLFEEAGRIPVPAGASVRAKL